MITPHCSDCGSACTAQGVVSSTPKESADGAPWVDLYRCSNDSCRAYERLPCYNDVWPFMRTRRGRSGEGTNCFSMLCRAVGARVRWVWSLEGLVWTEVYSEAQRRWVHFDACEELWDNPRLYEVKWGKKLSYCIAFSVDGATDVTWRYMRYPKEVGDRVQCSEEELDLIIGKIRDLRRAQMPLEDRLRLQEEDAREKQELQMYSREVYIHSTFSHELSREKKRLWAEKRFANPNPPFNKLSPSDI